MPLPNFLIIGSQKSGTTSLWNALRQHPGVFLAHNKEPHFFSLDEEYARGIDSYMRLFDNAVAAMAVGEASTSYTMNVHRPHAPQRIAQHLPEARLIYIVRHPLRRIESCYHHLRFKNLTRHSFASAVQSIPHMIDTSLYWKQINFYRDSYPDERIQVLFFEDFCRNIRVTLQNVFRFLELDPDVPIEDLSAKHVSQGRRVDGALLSWCRRYPWLMRAGQFVPRRIRTASINILTKEISDSPQWTASLQEYVLRQIEDDSQRFLEYYGKSPDYWSMRKEDATRLPASG